MKITLDHSEIEEAIISFVGSQGIPIADKHVSISLVTDGEDVRANIKVSNEKKTSDHTVKPEPAKPQSPPEPEPVFENKLEPSENIDRERLKKELDQRNIHYAPKARTATLISLLEEAQDAEDSTTKEDTPQEESTENVFKANAEENVSAQETVVEEKEATGNLFGDSIEEEAEKTSTEETPFDTPSESSTKEEEEVDDDKPLFGN